MRISVVSSDEVAVPVAELVAQASGLLRTDLAVVERACGVLPRDQRSTPGHWSTTANSWARG